MIIKSLLIDFHGFFPSTIALFHNRKYFPTTNEHPLHCIKIIFRLLYRCEFGLDFLFFGVGKGVASADILDLFYAVHLWVFFQPTM